MRESVTKGSVVALIVARIPEDSMQGLELEQGSRKVESTSRLWHPRWHLVAVAGLLITGLLLIYKSTGFRMGTDALISPLPSLSSTSETPQNSSPLDSTNFNVANVSILPAPSPANTSIVLAAAPSPANISIVLAVPPSPVNVSIVLAAAPSPANVSIPVAPNPESAGNVSAGSRDSWSRRVYYQNMSETWHAMSDRRLLRKATTMTVGDGPGVATKLAFLFMARGPLPFAPLWERYFGGDLYRGLYSIYIHAHPDYVPSWAPSSPFFGRFVPSKVVKWGTLSVYEAERRLLGNALLDTTNEWFLLLSESCIPIFNFPETYNYFNDSPGVSYIESYVDSKRQGQGRLYRGHYADMEPEITATNFRKGSQWFQITRDLALMAANNSMEYTKFEKYFCKIHPVCYIDEHFLPTLAGIVRPHAIAYRTLTYYSFRGKSPHPTKYDKGNTDVNLIQWFRTGRNCTYNGQMTSKCYLFVRKFDQDALNVLLNLASPVMGIP